MKSPASQSVLTGKGGGVAEMGVGFGISLGTIFFVEGLGVAIGTGGTGEGLTFVSNLDSSLGFSDTDTVLLALIAANCGLFGLKEKPNITNADKAKILKYWGSFIIA